MTPWSVPPSAQVRGWWILSPGSFSILLPFHFSLQLIADDIILKNYSNLFSYSYVQSFCFAGLCFRTIYMGNKYSAKKPHTQPFLEGFGFVGVVIFSIHTIFCLLVSSAFWRLPLINLYPVQSLSFRLSRDSITFMILWQASIYSSRAFSSQTNTPRSSTVFNFSARHSSATMFSSLSSCLDSQAVITYPHGRPPCPFLIWSLMLTELWQDFVCAGHSLPRDFSLQSPRSLS